MTFHLDNPKVLYLFFFLISVALLGFTVIFVSNFKFPSVLKNTALSGAKITLQFSSNFIIHNFTHII